MTTNTTPTLLTEVQSLALPDTDALTRSANAALRMAATFEVTCDEDYEMAAEELKAVKTKIMQLEVKRKTVSDPLYKAWNAFNALFKGPMDALKQAESVLKNAMIAYASEQERLAEIARQEAEKLAAAERKRIEDAAKEVERLALVERQRLAKIESDRVAAAQAEQDRLAVEAVAAAAAGDAPAAAEAERLANEAFEQSELAAAQAIEAAEQASEAAACEVASLQMTAAVTVAPVLSFTKAKAAGTSIAKSLDYKVTDKLALVKHIAAHPDLISLLMADDVKLRAYVRGLGMNTNLPGVSVFEKKTLSARAA